MLMPRRPFLASASAAYMMRPRLVSAQASPHLLVGTTPVDGGIAPLVGVRAGFFKKYGLDVDVQSSVSGAATAAAIVGGSLNIGASNILGLISARARGLPFQIVAPQAMYLSEKPTQLLVVRKDSNIRNAADLAGKTVASSALGDLLSISTLLWIDQHGGDSTSVRRVELSSAAIPAALQSGRVDAAGLQEPRLSEELRSGNVRVIGKMYDAVGKRFLVTAMFATSTFANENRDLLTRYARAQLEANVFANAHQDQTALLLAEFAKVDLRSIQGTQRQLYAETLDLSMIQPVIDAAVRYKVIDRAIDARELISPVVLSNG